MGHLRFRRVLAAMIHRPPLSAGQALAPHSNLCDRHASTSTSPRSRLQPREAVSPSRSHGQVWVPRSLRLGSLCSSTQSFFFFNGLRVCTHFVLIILFIYLFLAVLGLHCCTGFSVVAESWNCPLAVVYRVLTEVASFIVGHEL